MNYRNFSITPGNYVIPNAARISRFRHRALFRRSLMVFGMTFQGLIEKLRIIISKMTKQMLSMYDAEKLNIEKSYV